MPITKDLHLPIVRTEIRGPAVDALNNRKKSGGEPGGTWSRELIKAMAMDIGKEVVAYIEVQYSKVIEAASSTFKLSVRNCIYNQIMAAIKVADELEIKQRLKDRKQHRRKWTAAWRKIRDKR